MSISQLDELQIALDPVGQAGVAAALVLIMFSVALGLRLADFQLLLERPALFGGGVLTQVVGLPFVTVVAIHAVNIPASIALGMIVVACCPGGASSNLLTYLARGNVAYSVSLTATSSLLAALLTPASILFWSHAYAPTARLFASIDVSPLLFLGQTMLLLGVPLFLGMLVAAKLPDVAIRWRRHAGLLGSVLLLGVILYGIARFYAVLLPALPFLGAVAVAHNALAFGLGAVAGWLLRADRTVRRALIFEVGIQNSGLALIILIGQLRGLGGAAAIAAVWGVWHLVAGGTIVALMRALDRRRG